LEGGTNNSIPRIGFLKKRGKGWGKKMVADDKREGKKNHKPKEPDPPSKGKKKERRGEKEGRIKSPSKGRQRKGRKTSPKAGDKPSNFKKGGARGN